MTTQAHAADSFLLRFQHYYEEREIANRLVESTEDSPFASLILRFDEIGERNAVIDLELSFLPGLDDFSRAGLHILQSFAVLREGVPPSAYAELLAETAKINIELPLGSFGLFADTGVLYFKHNSFQNSEWLDSPTALEHVDRQNALIVHQFYTFADHLLNVAQIPGA